MCWLKFGVWFGTSNKCNMGYGFVNMTTPEAVWRLYKTFHNQKWGVFDTRKICEVTYARLQVKKTKKDSIFNLWSLISGL